MNETLKKIIEIVNESGYGYLMDETDDGVIIRLPKHVDIRKLTGLSDNDLSHADLANTTDSIYNTLSYYFVK